MGSHHAKDPQVGLGNNPAWDLGLLNWKYWARRTNDLTQHRSPSYVRMSKNSWPSLLFNINGNEEMLLYYPWLFLVCPHRSAPGRRSLSTSSIRMMGRHTQRPVVSYDLCAYWENKIGHIHSNLPLLFLQCVFMQLEHSLVRFYWMSPLFENTWID